MKRILLLLAVGMLAIPAAAEPLDRSNTPIYTPTDRVDMDSLPLDRGTAVYDSLYAGTAGYFAYPPALGPIGFDDYDTISGVNLTSVKFVGGASTAGGVFWFEYYTAGGTFATSFGVQFPVGGNWIWTITMSAPPFVIPHTGILQLVANTTFTGGGGTYSTTIPGQWFFTSWDALVVGSNSTGFGPPPVTTTNGRTVPAVHDFSFHIPEPTTFALLGLGLAALMIRRK